MQPLDARGLRIGVFLHAGVILLLGTSLARGSGLFDAIGLFLLVAAAVGYVTARFVRDDVDSAHTAFVAGAVGGLIAAAIFITSVRADEASGVFWQFHYALATGGFPGWLVADYGDLVVIAAGFLIGALYAFAALAGGAVGAGELIQVGQPDRPGDDR